MPLSACRPGLASCPRAQAARFSPGRPVLLADSCARQGGIAAIEFAFSLMIIFMLLFGIVTYGALFWTQQRVSHLAAEAGRHAVIESVRGSSDLQATVCDAHIARLGQQDALLQPLLPATGATAFCMLEDSRLSGRSCPAQMPAARCATITITVSVTGWPLLNTMRGLARLFTRTPEKLIPQVLASRAVVRLVNREPAQ